MFRVGSSLTIIEPHIKKWWNLITLTCLHKQKTEWTLGDVGLTFSNTYILNSGNCWYFWNSASHSSWLVGGFISFIKCQSTIERPDSVNLREGRKFECESECVRVCTQCWVTHKWFTATSGSIHHTSKGKHTVSLFPLWPVPLLWLLRTLTETAKSTLRSKKLTLNA